LDWGSRPNNSVRDGRAARRAALRTAGRLRTHASVALRLSYSRARAEVHWRLHRRQRIRLTARMTAAVTGTDLLTAPATLARRLLVVQELSNVALAQPALWSRVRVDPARVARIRELDRGVIITSIHAPTMWLSAAAGAAMFGFDILWAAGDQALQQNPAALSLPARGEVSSSFGGMTLIRSIDSYMLMRERLRAHGMVGLLFDVPGPTEVRMLGKRTMVHPWVGKLALYQNAVIVPALGVWQHNHMVLELGDLVEPTPGESVQSICQRTATAVERLWLQFPDHWAPYTWQLWPDITPPYRWAFDDHPAPPVL
jgi:hypothetical protein